MTADISRHMLELALNAQDAGAHLVEIKLDFSANGRTLRVMDDGRGMCGEELEKCARDGFSTKGTEGRGLGKVKSECKTLDVVSNPDEGTCVTAKYDGDARMGDIAATIAVLLTDKSDLTLELNIEGKGFYLDTRTLEEKVDDTSRQRSVKAAKDRINHFIELNGGAML